MKVSKLTGAALDWAVAKCENTLPASFDDWTQTWPRYSTDWAEGGPIIEREKLELRPGLYHSELWSCWGQTQDGERQSQQGRTGPTPLVAGMRCYVASKLGDTVDIPEELL